MKNKLKIVHISSEVSPYSKSGGLGDVVHALPKAQAKLGHEVIIITPRYGMVKNQEKEGKIKTENVKENLSLEINGEKINYKFKKANLSDNGLNLPVYFFSQEELFGRHSKLYGYENDNLRFLAFNLAAIELLEQIGFEPDIIHCHDWQTALVPNYLKLKYQESPFFKKTSIILTIHNITFQLGHNWWEIKDTDDGKGLPPLEKDKIEKINFLKRGIIHADAINTVSERHAQEILTKEFSQGLENILNKRKDDVYGIINGIDYEVFNPAFDKNIYVNYDWNSLNKKIENKLALQKELGLKQDKEIPMIGLSNRLTEQKGFDLLMEIIKHLLNQELQIVIVGSGEKEYINFFKKIAKRHAKKIAVVSPFTEEMSSKVYAASDMYLLPSRFEPCGLSQLVSLRYGSIPIIHETGGLSDTITDFNPRTNKGNGFTFKNYVKYELLIAITRAIETYKHCLVWERLTWQAMGQSYSWELPAKKYLLLYRKILKKFEEK